MRKFRIIATGLQLDNLGICYDLTGLIGIFNKEYNDGYYVLSVTHKIGEYDFINTFDIPFNLLGEIIYV